MKLLKKCEEKMDLRLEAIPTSSLKLDSLIGDGFQTGILSHIYGPPGSGKTNICMATAIECVKMNRKVAYIDTENGFNAVRFKQMCQDPEIAKKILMTRPTDFDEQTRLVKDLPKYVDESFGLVVLDSAVSLYRLKVAGDREEIIKFSRKLAKQAAALAQLANDRRVSVIITNHVYDSFKKKGVSPVGGDTLMYWSKMILELQKEKRGRAAILKKHPFLPDGKAIKFRITNSGLG